MRKKLTIIFIFFLLSGCGGLKFENDKQATSVLKQMWKEFFVEDFNDTKTVEVFVVTNRKPYGKFACGDNSFGIAANNSLSFGTCLVNVPKNHGTGEINLAKDNRQSSNDYFKMLESSELQEQDLIRLIKNKRNPLVFVHGFNVNFSEAVLRAAQIAYDLKYQGPIILFTWPAGAQDSFFADAMLKKTYQNNLNNAKSSVVLFKNFLTNLSKNDITVNLMVHSMGHQVVLPALVQLAEANPKKQIVGELILNAPDFDAKEFKALIKNVKLISNRITLYCSYNDKAMFASKTLNNNERLGACTLSSGVDSVNVSLVDNETFGLGHGYYSSRAILTDVFQTLLGIDVDKRLFIKKSELNSTERYFLRQ